MTRIRTACATAMLLALSGFMSDGPEAASADIQSYVGEIALVGFNFVPNGWAPADGRTLPIPDYDALFNLIRWTYGGDSTYTFALPKLDPPAPGMTYIVALYGRYPTQ